MFLPSSRFAPLPGLCAVLATLAVLVVGSVGMRAQQSLAFAWQYSTPEQQGVDSEGIARMLMQVQRESLQVHSFILIRHDRIVAEAYWNPYTAGTRHILYSASKSFTSAAVGIAIERGLLGGTGERVVDIFRGVTAVPPSENMNRMTLQHLLAMCTGHTFDTTYRVVYTSDWVRSFMELPVDSQPGSAFRYNSGATMMLSAAVQRRTGANLLSFVATNIFAPLGITDYYWENGPNNVTAGGWGLYLRPLDMAKFGRLYLHEGRWGDEQVVPAAWVAESSRPQISTGSGGFWGSGYGYQFWMNDFGGYRADGAYGQYIFILPAYDAVIVFTSNLASNGIPGDLVRSHLLPAMSPATALVPNLRADGLVARLCECAGIQATSPNSPPVFTALPVDQTVLVGETVNLTAGVAGLPTPVCQWYKDGIPVSGATGTTLSLANVGVRDAGDYAVVATNANGQTAGFTISLGVLAPPQILSGPAPVVVARGDEASFQVRAGGGGLSYEWRRNGEVIAGAREPVLRISTAADADAGDYRVTITNARGSVASEPARLTVSSRDDSARLVNLSVRALGGAGDETLIVGFVVGGSEAAAGLPVLLRGLGPSLAGYGVAGSMTDPAITLHGAGGPLASNGDWCGDALAADVGSRIGACEVPGWSADAALHATLAPGNYTLHLTSSLPDREGIALAECYDASDGGAAGAPGLVNVSARAQVGAGDGTLIAGFVIFGGGGKRVLVRGIGPSLADHDVTGALVDPQLDLYADGSRIATNAGWGGDPELRAAFEQAGAFGLPEGSADTALVLSLPAGVYTAHVSSRGGRTGVALIEVYALP